VTVTVQTILYNKEYKAKEKAQLLCKGLLNQSFPLSALISEIQLAKDIPKATCIEALTHAAEQVPTILTEETLILLIQTLSSKAPRVKWECARAIGHTIALYPNQAEYAIQHLVEHMNHEGTVVRWSIASAFGEILKINGPFHTALVSLAEQQIEKEKKKSIQKIYQQALKRSVEKQKQL